MRGKHFLFFSRERKKWSSSFFALAKKEKNPPLLYPLSLSASVVPISVCIPVKNGASTLGATLESLRPFPEVILLDNGSEDGTRDVASSYPNVKWVQTQFQGFGRLRNEAASFAANDWILALDADETISPPLLEEISSLPLSNPKEAYSFPRCNYYNGKWIKGCGWYPDRVVRLYHRGQTAFDTALVHESLRLTPVCVLPLSSPLLHTPYRSTSDFLRKMECYSSLFAEQYQNKRPSSLSRALIHAFFAFFKSYVLKRGFLDGAEGFVISLYNGNTAFYKYLKLAEKNRFGYPEDASPNSSSKLK